MKTMSSLAVSAWPYSWPYSKMQIAFRGMVALTLVAALFWVITRLPNIPPDTGFSSPQESKQFDKLVDVQMDNGGMGAGIALLPLFLGAFGAVLFFWVSLSRRKVLTTKISEAIQMEGEGEAVGPMIDGYGHVNYIASILNLDWCRHELMKAGLTCSLEDLRDTHKLALMMKQAEVKYHAQIRPRQQMHFVGTMRKVSPVRVELLIQIFAQENDGSSELAVECMYVMPLVSLETGRPCKIPDWLIVKEASSQNS